MILLPADGFYMIESRQAEVKQIDCKISENVLTFEVCGRISASPASLSSSVRVSGAVFSFAFPRAPLDVEPMPLDFSNFTTSSARLSRFSTRRQTNIIRVNAPISALSSRFSRIRFACSMLIRPVIPKSVNIRLRCAIFSLSVPQFESSFALNTSCQPLSVKKGPNTHTTASVHHMQELGPVRSISTSRDGRTEPRV